MSKYIELSNPHRKKHFDFFKNMDQPHFNICANVEISGFLDFIKRNGYSFTPTMVYFLSKAANEITEFRWRIRGEQILEHPAVHPSFTVYTEVADVFSFCTVDYYDNFFTFLEKTLAEIDKMLTEPSFEDDEHRDDFLFMSSIPWVSFTSFAHAMHYTPADAIPRITWGKVFKEGAKNLMPLSVQAHHAVVDGRHTGKYFELFQAYMNEPSAFLNS
ncbi:MAG: chloramphenicol acetyltransferase [Bacteroidota bacterium]